MKQEELVKGLAYLGMAYGKEYSKIECEQIYDFLKDYSYEVFIIAIKNIIRTSKFLPKINELLEACENAKETPKFGVIEFMNARGYFKSPNEYTKATLFVERGNVPYWLQEDMNRYYKMMKQESLNHKETLRIGG